MADVVAVAEIGQPQTLEPAELVPQRQQIAQRLDRVEALGQRIEDRNGGAAHEGDEIVVGAEARRDPVDVAAEDLRGVGQRLAPGELKLVRAEKGGMAAELLHPGLERVARAGAGMLEEHAQGLAGQVGMGPRRARAGS